ncbi:MAG: gamma-glutamylcyclotransferase [Bdellovibrionota bacterium]
MTTMRFFVIGSWTEGLFHFQKLKPFIVSNQPASLRALVYKLPIGFPVIVAQNNSNSVGADINAEQIIEQADEIIGQLLELKNDDTLLTLMDSLHGVRLADPSKGLHKRSSVKVTTSSGDQDEAQVYFFNPLKLKANAHRIMGGVWREYLTLNPPLTERLTEKQKTYILKLGSIKGRDIVPINDLTLYRELMKLELIVDKGRRLALSSLGKEVYNHLI